MDTVLTSASNPTVKRLRKLMVSAKERREAGLAIAEGTHLTQSFLASGRVPKMFVCAESAQKNHEVAELIEELSATPTERIIVSDDIFESIASIHAGSGILIIFEPPKAAMRAVLPLKTTAVLLESIQDPGNLGTILRTAVAVGIKHVLLSPACASPWSPKALRAGMGAQFGVVLYENADILTAIRTAQVPTAATVLRDDSVSLYDIDFGRPIAWLFGSEGQGVSETLAATATLKVTIPQEVATVESLNVATAAAVCLYEQYRQTITAVGT